MTITELEQAVSQLSEQELSRFRAWFDEYYAQIWDKQIEEDAKSGRLDKVIAEVNGEYDAGLSKPL
jgi:DNA-binding SARP family transcriptional activator